METLEEAHKLAKKSDPTQRKLCYFLSKIEYFFPKG